MYDIERNDENGTASHYDMDIKSGNNQLEKFSVGGSNTMTQEYDEMGQMTSKMPYSWPVNTNPDEQIDTINWTADGKINYIVYSKLLEIYNDLTEEVEEEMVMFKKYYYYDGMGNRVAVITDANFHQCNNIGKTIFDHCESGISPSIPPVLYYDCEECLEKNSYVNEYYTYEAGGKLLTKYDKIVYWSDACGSSLLNYCSNTITDYQTTNLEWYVYGSASDGRIATVYPRFDIKDDDSFDDNFENDPPNNQVAYNTEMISNTFTANAVSATITGIETHRHLGEKRYEIKDHLGNVRATVSDIKNAENYSLSASSWKFLADIKSMSNYFPYGMKIDAGSWSPSKYHFAYNGKQEESFDKDFLHYGARSHDTEIGRFIKTDKLENYYVSLSPYSMVGGNPINSFDPDGNKIIFVNGYYKDENIEIPLVNKDLNKNIGTKSKEGYWSKKFIEGAIEFFNDKNTMFIDGKGSVDSGGEERFNAGRKYAEENYASIISVESEDETIKIVTHSMGAAFAEGILSYLKEKDENVKVEIVIHLSPADPSEIVVQHQNTIQLNLENDAVLFLKNFLENNKIEGVARYGEVKTTNTLIDDMLNNHGFTKLDSKTWELVEDLMKINFSHKKNVFSIPYLTIEGGSNVYKANNSETIFNKVNIKKNEYINQNDGTYKGPYK